MKERKKERKGGDRTAVVEKSPNSAGNPLSTIPRELSMDGWLE